MIQCKKIVNNKFQSNCYILSNLNRAVVIDPGEINSENILKYIQKQGIEVNHILLTHEHFDHIMSVNIIKELFNCKLVCSDECADLIGDSKKNLSYYCGYSFISSKADIIFDQHYTLEWNNTKFDFFKTQGHSIGSVCISIEDHLFTGDTLINNIKTVTHLPGSNKTKLFESINFIITNFPKNTLVHPGHGDSFQLAELNLIM